MKYLKSLLVWLCFIPVAILNGGIWMLLTVLFEFTSGIGTGVPIEELIAAYNPLSGNLWILVVLTTMFAPTIISRIKR